MRRLALIVCLLIGTVAAHAQFEKESGLSTLPLPDLIFPTIRKRIRLISVLRSRAVLF